MEPMTKQRLSMYALIRTEIDNQLEWLARMKNNELLPAPVTGTGGGRSGVSDRMANAINRRLDLEARVLPQIEAGLAELEAIESAIDALDNPLEREVLREPRLALDGGEDGLDFYRRLAAEYRDYLNPGGRLYLEIGYDQGTCVPALFPFSHLEKDLSGQDRVVWTEV